MVSFVMFQGKQQDGKPIKWTCDEEKALGYIVAEYSYFLPKYPDSTYQAFYSLKWSKLHYICGRWCHLVVS